MRQTQNAQKKDNRKSIFVIGLLLLLVAVIGFGGYTLSKYVTEKKETGHASVAKWGFTVETKTGDLFGAKYKFDDTKNSSVVTTDDTAATLTVKASDTENRVAPGTTGSMTFTIKGSAEVKAKVEIALTVNNDVVLEYKKGEVAGTYKPVKWTLKKDGNVVVSEGKSLENVTLAEIATALNGYGATVNASGTYAHAGTYTIEWAWAYDATTENADADKLDTLLGWTANGTTTIPDGYGFTVETGTQTTIDFALKISITQVKE